MTAPFPIRQIAEERGLRLFKEEGYDSVPRAERDWYLELRGRGGVLYPHDATSFWVDTTSGKAASYAAIPHERALVSPDGREARFLFLADALDAALRELRPRKKRVLSDEQRQLLIERLAASRFRAGRFA